MVVGPHRALDLAEIARNIDKTAIAIGPRSAAIRCLSIYFIPTRKRGAPTIIVKGTGEVMNIGGTVALRAVVSVVKVQLGLIATKAVVLSAAHRCVVVDPCDNGLAVATLDEGWGQGARRSIKRSMARSIAPYAVGLLGRKPGMETLIRRDLGQCHDVADLGEELVPSLMGEDFTWWPSFNWSSIGNGVGEICLGGTGRRLAEVSMIRESPSISFACKGATKHSICLVATIEGRHGDWML